MLETVSSCERFVAFLTLEAFVVALLLDSISSADKVDITRFASSSSFPIANTTGL